MRFSAIDLQEKLYGLLYETAVSREQEHLQKAFEADIEGLVAIRRKMPVEPVKPWLKAFWRYLELRLAIEQGIKNKKILSEHYVTGVASVTKAYVGRYRGGL